MSTDLFERQVAWHRTEATNTAPTRLPLMSVIALATSTLLILALATVLYVQNRAATLERSVNALRIEASALRAQIPPCPEPVAEVQQVRDFLAKGQTAVAIGLAESALAQRAALPCPKADTLTAFWYRASLDELLATRPGDDAASRQAVSRWLAIERNADRFGTRPDERRPPLVLAKDAYDRGLWQLADAAFRRAWDDGEPGGDAIGFRYALLRNWGVQLTSGLNAKNRQQGIQLLTTAHAIATAARLSRGEACEDLKALGVGCAEFSADPTEPVLREPAAGQGVGHALPG